MDLAKIPIESVRGSTGRTPSNETSPQLFDQLRSDPKNACGPRWLESEDSTIAGRSNDRSSLRDQRYPIAWKVTYGLGTDPNMTLKVGYRSSGSSRRDSRTILGINRIGSKHLILDICEFVYCLHHQLLTVWVSETSWTYSLADNRCSCEFEESYYRSVLSCLIIFVYRRTMFSWEIFGIYRSVLVILEGCDILIISLIPITIPRNGPRRPCH